VFLARFIGGLGPPPNPIYEGDLNADGWVDYGDVEMLWSIIQGKLVVEWPLATVCDPDTTRGSCWGYDSCSVRSLENCAAMDGLYLGDGSFCDGPCYADGDMNGDGYPLS
jgi:hypothetical protein